VIGQLAAMGHRVGAVRAAENETQGVNDRWQLAMAERELRNRTNRHWLLNGVTMLDPRQTFIDVTVTLAATSPSTRARSCRATPRSARGPTSALTRSSSTARSDGTASSEQTVGSDAEVGDGAVVGPFAHLPAGSTVAAERHDRRVLHCSRPE
jgi:bifunctional UDP-N-acetylglucosamine pyrophosphorylase/glucosamine-1-phosphate N-acetyltransferase